MSEIITFLNISVAISIFFVWVIRYKNIISEFQEYNYPEWFRDFIGIIKLIFASILITQTSVLYLVASFGVAFLMAGAVITHFKFKHALYKALPSFSLMSICLFLGISTI